jgi:osmotically-inducible protein OsmY
MLLAGTVRPLVASLAVLCGVVACGGAPPPAPLEAPTALRGTPAFQPTGSVSDAAIVATMQRELGNDPVTGSESFEVTSQGGVVVMHASVATPLAAKRALEIAHVVRGVRAIVNNVSVVGALRPHRELELAVESALRRDPATAAQRVHVRVERGAVRLSGEVDSAAVRGAAVNDALGVPGVGDVVDDLVVRGTAGSDSQLAAAARRAIADDVWLDGAAVLVDAGGAVVRLHGWVATRLELSRALADAWAAAPVAVDARRLQLAQLADDGTLRESPPQSRSDAELTQSLLDAIVQDDRVFAFAPTVDVHRGVFVLTGVAPDAATARAIASDAREVPGTRAVLDYLKTPPTVRPLMDADLRHEITRAIEADPALAGSYVTITVLDGRVYLRGTVPDDETRFRLLALAAAVPATRDVADGLVVAPSIGVGSMQRP